MLKLYTSPNSFEIGLMKSALDDKGLECFVQNENLSSLAGEVPAPETWPQLWIRDDEDLEQARSALQELQSQKPGDQYWECGTCGQQIPENFEVCWNCEAADQPASGEDWENLVIHVSLTPAEQKKGKSALSNRNRIIQIVTVVGLLLVALGLYNLAALVFAMFCLLLTVRSESFLTEYQATISRKGLSIITDDAATVIEWETVVKAILTSELIVLRCDSGPVVVPRRAVANEDDLQKLVELIEFEISDIDKT